MKKKHPIKRFLLLLFLVVLVAALAAEGDSRVHGSEYVERGYEKIEDAFSFLGGDIRLT